MRVFTKICRCGPQRLVFTRSSVAVVTCSGCGTPLRLSCSELPAPEHPARTVSYPTVEPDGSFGMFTLTRRVIGSRTDGGQTEILCRYGEDIEKWYPVAA